MRKVMVIGITGNLGSGKTTVARMFARKGAFVIDADNVCRYLMRPSKKPYKKLIRHFGDSILKRDDTINRKKLADIVFNNKSKLRLLNRIIHPEAIKEIGRLITTNKKKRIIVIDAALLVESNFYKKMDRIIVVKADRKKTIGRLVRARGLTKADILKRIRTQAPFKKKLALADYIIDNSGSRKKTLFQADEIWKKIRGEICLQAKN